MSGQKLIQLIVILAIIGAGVYWWTSDSGYIAISDFEGCSAAGYPIAESYPRQCITPDGRVFVEDLGIVDGDADDLSSGGQTNEETYSLSSADVVGLVRNYLAGAYDVNADEVVILKSERVDFKDSCLGIISEGVMCAQVITPGYEVVAQADGQVFTFRASTDGSTIIPVE